MVRGCLFSLFWNIVFGSKQGLIFKWGLGCFQVRVRKVPCHPFRRVRSVWDDRRFRLFIASVWIWIATRNAWQRFLDFFIFENLDSQFYWPQVSNDNAVTQIFFTEILNYRCPKHFNALCLVVMWFKIYFRRFWPICFNFRCPSLYLTNFN